MLGACLDAPTHTGITPDQRHTSEAPAEGFTSQFEIPATWAPPPTIVGYWGVNLLPTPITIQPGKYRIDVRVQGYVTVQLGDLRRSTTLQAGPGGVPGYLQGVDYPWRTLVAQVAVAPPAYVTRDPLKSSAAWIRIPLKPDPNYPDSSVYTGELVFEPKVPYVVVLDRYGAEFTEAGHRALLYVLNMTSNQQLTVTVTPVSEAPQLGVVCKNSSGASAVPRGTDVTCTASGFTEGKELDWKFVPDADPNAPITESRTAAEWRGTMAATGTVSVQERGGTLAASTRVLVTARAWPRFRVRPVIAGHGGETDETWKQDDRPQRIGHLGHAHHIVAPATLDAEQISGGPNRGYWYLKSFPTEIPSIIHMSRAWKAGHPFHEMQRAGPVLDWKGNAVLDPYGTPVMYCRKSQLTDFEQASLRHEREHVAEMDAFWRANSPIAGLESVAVTPGQLGATPFSKYVEARFYAKANETGVGYGRWEHVPVGKVALVAFPCQLRFYP
jgi:hypothetical protein